MAVPALLLWFRPSGGRLTQEACLHSTTPRTPSTKLPSGIKTALRHGFGTSASPAANLLNTSDAHSVLKCHFTVALAQGHAALKTEGDSSCAYWESDWPELRGRGLLKCEAPP